MSNLKQWRSLTQNLRKVLDELPSSSERKESVNAINELMAVLGDLSNAFGAMPSIEEASKAKEALMELENIVNRNPILRRISNGKAVKPRANGVNKSPKPDGFFSEEVIRQTIADLNEMPETTMRSELENAKRFPNSFLKAILSHLGRRVPSKGVKSEMVDQLVATLINRRTYRGLSGERW